MQIISLVHGKPLRSTDDMRIVPSPEGEAAVKTVLARAKRLKEVTDGKTQGVAADVAAELAGLRAGLKKNYDEAKAPFVSGGRTLDRIFHAWDDPMKAAYDTVTSLIARYRDDQRRQQELAKAKAEAEQRQREQAERARLTELQRQKE